MSRFRRACTETTSPSRPDATSSFSIAYFASKRRMCPTIRNRPAACAASIIRVQSARSVASGFSTKTCFPRARAVTTGTAWSASGVTTSTRSTSGRPQSSSSEVQMRGHLEFRRELLRSWPVKIKHRPDRGARHAAKRLKVALAEQAAADQPDPYLFHRIAPTVDAPKRDRPDHPPTFSVRRRDSRRPTSYGVGASDQGPPVSFRRYDGSNPASLAMTSSLCLGGASFSNQLSCQVLPSALHWQKNSGFSVRYTTLFSKR